MSSHPVHQDRTQHRTGHAFERARAIADAVLYEGYILFPYHAGATKNRYRWQFGVLVPEAQVEAGSSEAAAITSQLLVRAGREAPVEVLARFLQPRLRQVEQARDAGRFEAVDALDVADELHTTWDEGVEHEHRIDAAELHELLIHPRELSVQLEATTDCEDLHDAAGVLVGRIVRTTEVIELRIEVSAELLADDVARLTTTVRNVTAWADGDAERAETVRHGVAGTHLLVHVPGGELASAIDPPAWAQPWAANCRNVGTFPVLVGDGGADDIDDVVLSAPIILYDHPEVADESPGDAYDATEIHELLSLCTTALPDEEKRAARATDPRAAAVIDDADHLPPELRERLHGAIRDLGSPSSASDGQPTADDGPFTDLAGTRLNEPDRAEALEQELADLLGVGEEPLTEVTVGGVVIALGDRVRLEPDRRADVQDVFVIGRVGVVGRIVETLEGEVQVGVTLEDDPAADLHTWYGRYLYFHLDEIAPLEGSEEGEAT